MRLVFLLLSVSVSSCEGSRGDPTSRLMGLDPASEIIERLRFKGRFPMPSSVGNMLGASQAKAASVAPVGVPKPPPASTVVAPVLAPFVGLPCDDPALTDIERQVCPPCPGDKHPSVPGMYYVEGQYVSLAAPLESCNGHEVLRDQGENPSCECQCRPFFGGGEPLNCTVNLRELNWNYMDCYNMSDTYLQACKNIASTVCKPYHMSWQLECYRTCKALQGKRCIREQYNTFCTHDPECPSMCGRMMNLLCDELYEKARTDVSDAPVASLSNTDAELGAAGVQMQSERNAEAQKDTDPDDSDNAKNGFWRMFD